MTIFLGAVVSLLISLRLFAQSDANKGQIAGTVFDQKQAVIPNAKISVRNTATGATRDVVSGQSTSGDRGFMAIGTPGAVVPPNATFMRIKRPDGLYDANDSQLGTPFQAQFRARFVF